MKKPKQERFHDEIRLVIVFDGLHWHVRHLRMIEHSLSEDEKVYYCDKPISNDHPTPEDAVESARSYQRGATRRAGAAT